MNNKTNGIILLIFVIIILFVSGCLSSGKGKEGGGELVYEWEEESFYGEGSGVAQSQPYEFLESFPFSVNHDNITQMMINITIQDGDEGTNPDHIDRIEFGPMSNEPGVVPFEINGDDTPFEAQLVFKAKEGEIFGADWYVTVQGVLYASDDQWPGPLIWRGIPDLGFMVDMEIRYEYIKEGDLTF